MSATQEQLFENIKSQIEKLMKAEVPLVEGNANEDINAIGRHAFPHPSRQDEFEGIMLTFMNNQERQIQQLEAHLKNTRNVFMELAEKFISRIKEKIREEASHKKIEKIFELPVPNESYNKVSDETPLSEPSPLHFSYPFEPPRKEMNSRVHSVFVGSIAVTFPNFHKIRKRSFGFKPGVEGTQFKRTLVSKIHWESFPHSKNTCHDGGWKSNWATTDPGDVEFTPNDSNRTFDPGGVVY